MLDTRIRLQCYTRGQHNEISFPFHFIFDAMDDEDDGDAESG